MGNSTTRLQDVYDWAKAKGIPVPTDQPGGYGTRLALKIGNDVMAAIIAERFNWKFNRAIAAPFLTNSYQQDYPQIGLTDIGWGEDVDKVDINNTAFPKPTNGGTPGGGMTWRRQLSRTSLALWPVSQICWMYNQDMVYGQNQATLSNPASWGAASWPGAHVAINPLLTSGPVIQNPILSMIDANGNLLVVSNLGSMALETGAVAPVLPANSAEGTAVADGTVIWTVAAPMSQGFRVFPLPGAAGPVYQITAYYQMLLQKMATLQALINPIPDDFNFNYQTGVEIMCKMSSADPNLRAEGTKGYPLWLAAMMEMRKQGNREIDAYGAIPAESVVESVYGWRGLRNPQDPGQPY
jgi:hypothetical protein